ncbi:MAG: molybdopterin adenylyltransferase [Glaciecola sp.]
MPAAAIVTCSDRVSRGEAQDGAGPVLRGMLEDAGYEVVEHTVVPDEQPQIEQVLRDLSSRDDVALVVATGGTGFAPRDVTPEATRAVIDREAPGLAEAMRAAGRAVTPLADLSRGVCGVVGSTLVLNLPGSTKGATESLAAVLPILAHALGLLADQHESHPTGPTA